MEIMSEKFYQSPHFKDLQKKWYDILKSNKFNDIESFSVSKDCSGAFQPLNPTKNDLFKHTKSPKQLENNLQTYQTTRDLYELKRSYYHVYPFRTTLDKLMWKYFSEGMSFRAISRRLQQFLPTAYTLDPLGKVKTIKFSFFFVRTKMQKIEKDMLAGKYFPKDYQRLSTIELNRPKPLYSYLAKSVYKEYNPYKKEHWKNTKKRREWAKERGFNV